MNRLLVAFLLLGSLVLLSGCGNDDDDGGSNGGTTPTTTTTPTGTTPATPSSPAGSSPSSSSSTTSASVIRLSAFSAFNCSSNWGNRDGAMGIKAHAGTGTCKATFPGETGTYNIRVKIQTERDGASSYSVGLNGSTIKQGNYPYACRKLQCNSSADECPDRNDYIDAGTHKVSHGASVTFTGSDTYPCGSEHGAYAKWHEMVFTRK